MVRSGVVTDSQQFADFLQVVLDADANYQVDHGFVSRIKVNVPADSEVRLRNSSIRAILKSSATGSSHFSEISTVDGNRRWPAALTAYVNSPHIRGLNSSK